MDLLKTIIHLGVGGAAVYCCGVKQFGPLRDVLVSLAHFNLPNIYEMSCGMIHMYINLIHLMECAHLQYRGSSFNLVCLKSTELIDLNLMSGRMPSETTLFLSGSSVSTGS